MASATVSRSVLWDVEQIQQSSDLPRDNAVVSDPQNIVLQQVSLEAGVLGAGYSNWLPRIRLLGAWILQELKVVLSAHF